METGGILLGLTHRVLGWDFDPHVYVIGHHMSLEDAAFLLPCQLMENRSERAANTPKQCLAAPFGHEYNMILAIPTSLRQPLIHIRYKVLFWLGSSSH